MLVCNYLAFLPIYFFRRVFLISDNYGNNKLFHIRAVPFMGLGSCLHLQTLIVVYLLTCLFAFSLRVKITVLPHF